MTNKKQDMSIRKQRIKRNSNTGKRTVVGQVIGCWEMFSTDRCRKRYNHGNPITVIKWCLN